MQILKSTLFFKPATLRKQITYLLLVGFFQLRRMCVLGSWKTEGNNADGDIGSENEHTLDATEQVYELESKVGPRIQEQNKPL